jgi:hypothetical protein
MTERTRVGELTTIQIDKETFGLLKSLCQVDLRSSQKELRFLVQAELSRRPIRIPVIPFTGKGDEIGDAFKAKSNE